MDIENIPDEVINVLKRILNRGGEAYIVGGALRDHILGKAIYDWDIATSLLPEEIDETFSDVHKVTTGRKFGTITVFMGDLPIEITTYRIEDDYIDFRHPSKVKFTYDIYEDLKRRDFTMNALAFNPLLERGQFIDPYDGHSDIKRGIIRAVGDPGERFSEDPLRMMRAIRFMAELGFEIEEGTLSSIAQNSHLIEKISAERIRDELNKTLLAQFVKESIVFLYSSGLQGHIVPESIQYLSRSTIESIASSLSLCSRDLIERLCAFFIWTVEIEDRRATLNKVLRRLRYDNDTRQNVVKILCAVDMPIDPRDHRIKYRIRKLMGSIGIENTLMVLRLRKLFRYDTENIAYVVNSILCDKDPIFKSDLAIDGHDIINMGIGRHDKRDIGKALDIAYDWVLKDPSLNERKVLLNRLGDLYYKIN